LTTPPQLPEFAAPSKPARKKISLRREPLRREHWPTENRHSHGGVRHAHAGGSIPHDHPPVPAGKPGNGKHIAGIVIGGLLLLARLVVPTIPISGTSLGEANSVCSGGLGVFARAFGGRQVVIACNHVSEIMLGLNVLALAGLALIIVCAIVLIRRSR
jgi:hypothetical protein